MHTTALVAPGSPRRTSWRGARGQLTGAALVTVVLGAITALAAPANATTLVSVSGVLATTDGLPFAGVTVHYGNGSGASVNAVTDGTGRYSMQLPPADGTLEVYGYDPTTGLTGV